MFLFIQVFLICPRKYFCIHIALAYFLLSLFLGILPHVAIINGIFHFLFCLLSIYDDNPIPLI